MFNDEATGSFSLKDRSLHFWICVLYCHLWCRMTNGILDINAALKMYCQFFLSASMLSKVNDQMKEIIWDIMIIYKITQSNK